MRATPLLTTAFVAALLPVIALATGLGGDAPPTRIPVPARPFSATITDRAGTSVKLTKLTWNGEIYLAGHVGKADAAVPFERIESVRVLQLRADQTPPEPEQQIAEVTLKGGETVQVWIDEDLSLYGLATWGNYRIEARDIDRIVVHGASDAQAAQ